MSFDSMKFAKGARRSAWRHTPPKLGQWREDIEQEIALYLVSRYGREPFNPEAYRWAALHAVRQIGLMLRGETELREAEVDALKPTESVPELRGLALWRLQKAWSTLTDVQQEGLGWMLAGRPAQGLSKSRRTVLNQAAKIALRRIDEPTAYARPARVRVFASQEERVEAKRVYCRHYMRARRAGVSFNGIPLEAA